MRFASDLFGGVESFRLVLFCFVLFCFVLCRTETRREGKGRKTGEDVVAGGWSGEEGRLQGMTLAR